MAACSGGDVSAPVAAPSRAEAEPTGSEAEVQAQRASPATEVRAANTESAPSEQPRGDGPARDEGQERDDDEAGSEAVTAPTLSGGKQRLADVFAREMRPLQEHHLEPVVGEERRHGAAAGAAADHQDAAGFADGRPPAGGLGS